jgi:hypothetical protein
MHDQHTLEPSPTGSVVLEIGAEVGALVLYVPAADHGREIEISRIGSAAPRTHAAVRERRLDGGSLYCAVYDGLPASEYTIWADETASGGTVTVIGGHVTEVDWTNRR